MQYAYITIVTNAYIKYLYEKIICKLKLMSWVDCNGKVLTIFYKPLIIIQLFHII